MIPKEFYSEWISFMEELTIIIIIYFVFLIGESPTKEKPVVDDEYRDCWICGTGWDDNRQNTDD